MAKYGIIKSTRIKDKHLFLRSLQITPGKEVTIMILLGSKDDFNALRAESAYYRKFNAEIWPLDNAFDLDVPPSMAAKFGPIDSNNIRVVEQPGNENLDPEILDRVVASVGLKPYVSDSQTPDSAKHYEVTAFTSFMPRAGALLLDYLVDHVLRERNIEGFDLQKCSKVVLHAVVIKDHDLVPYYTRVCHFVLSGQADLLIEASVKGSVLGGGIVAGSDFTLSFLHRDVALQDE